MVLLVDLYHSTTPAKKKRNKKWQLCLLKYAIQTVSMPKRLNEAKQCGNRMYRRYVNNLVASFLTILYSNFENAFFVHGIGILPTRITRYQVPAIYNMIPACVSGFPGGIVAVYGKKYFLTPSPLLVSSTSCASWLFFLVSGIPDVNKSIY